jgi:hypothetical protein
MKKIKPGNFVVGEHYSTGERLTGYYSRESDSNRTRLALEHGRHWVMTKHGATMLIKLKHGDRQEELDGLIAIAKEAYANGKAQLEQLKYQLRSAKENVADQRAEIKRRQEELNTLRLSRIK